MPEYLEVLINDAVIRFPLEVALPVKLLSVGSSTTNVAVPGSISSLKSTKTDDGSSFTISLALGVESLGIDE